MNQVTKVRQAIERCQQACSATASQIRQLSDQFDKAEGKALRLIEELLRILDATADEDLP